jgi:transcription antitermination factor NusG
MVGGTDQRDALNWVVLELTRTGEVKAEEGLLEGLLREALKSESEHPIFIPSMSYQNGGRRVTVALMEGYAFIASGLTEMTYFGLENSPYVRRVLSTRTPNGMRALSVIPDSRVQEMRVQLAQQVSSDIMEGMRVTVTDGVYNRLDGEVVQIDGDSARVRFVLRSLDLIAPVPRVFLTPIKEEDP